ncbi:MAG: T9SS type A sorting domain-containing protein [Bacteroidales bacterium]|nr:T9SS type A sorting domain-containing protein [Bacteroidales bacterium]
MLFIVFFLFTFRCLFAGFLADDSMNKTEKGLIAAAKDYDQRMDLYDVKFYKIDLEITDTSTFLSGSTSVLLQIVADSGTELVFDMLSDLTVDSVRLDGKNVSCEHVDDKLIVLPDNVLQYKDTCMVTVYYSGLGKQKSWISGIYNARQDIWNKNVTWTLSEPFAARNWFPCKQILSDKADSACIYITTNSELRAGSNGLLENVVNLPGNRTRYEWKTRYPVAYYLLSFAVGDYRDYSYYVHLPGCDDSLLVQNYIYDTLAFFEYNKEDIDKTADLIILYSKLFGTYPFFHEKYGHCIVPTGGGMEHQTMTTLGSFYFLLVAHELAHQWFGDYVTCADWQDIWINEGFASYSEYIAYQYLKSQEKADLWMADAHDYIKTENGGSVFVPEAFAFDENRIFDYRLSYKKGAAIIHMIRGEIQNDSLFFAILRDYLNRYKNNVAYAGDFKELLEEKTGRDFNAFFNQWYYGEGYPSITVNWKHEHDTLYAFVFLTSSTTQTPMFDILTGYKISLNDRDSIIYRRHNKQYDEWKISMPGRVKKLDVDPEKWLLIDVTGINNLSESVPKKTIYLEPNPAKGWVNVHFTERMTETEIYVIDTAGKLIFSEKSDRFPFTINLRGYMPGSYIVLATNAGKIYTEKLILTEP